MNIGMTSSVSMIGLDAYRITIQAVVSSGLPYFSIIGLPDTSLAEARERVKAACISSGFPWPDTRITVNMSPASLPKRGSIHDLAIATAVLTAGKFFDAHIFENSILLGELNLDGSLLPIQGLLPILIFAKRQGIRTVYIPYGNLEEAKLIQDIEIIPLHSLRDCVERFGTKKAQKLCRQSEHTSSEHRIRNNDPNKHSVEEVYGHHESRNSEQITTMEHSCTSTDNNHHIALTAEPHDALDMNQIVGQDEAKYACEIAVTGGHHILFTGPPGSGKTMLAMRIPSIMATLTEEEALEVASIQSLSGIIPHTISRTPPYEAPHHSASMPALVGGGTGIARPGSITRAHRGILFLDEAPEFSCTALQALREPLETGYITLSRSQGITQYPAAFQLVMAANPCPCGYSNTHGHRCRCSSQAIRHYFNKISGPLLDRIDIQITVPPVMNFSAQRLSGDASAMIQQRVIEGRERARHRFKEFGWQCNAQASHSWIQNHVSSDIAVLLEQEMCKHTLSARGAHRAMKLAWTLADLDARNSPSRAHILQAITLRTQW